MSELEDDADFRLTEEQRAALQLELERWLIDCERRGNTLFNSGVGGHIADRLTLTMRVDDSGFCIEANRSRTTEIEP